MRILCKTPIFMQMERTECGAAALGSILAYHGVHLSLESLREACDISRDGSNALALIEVARSYHMEASGVRADLTNLAERVVFPAIIFWKFNHFLVLEGFDSKRQEYYLNDPARGRLKVSHQQFDEGFTGVALNFSKTANFKSVSSHRKIGSSIIRRLLDSKRDLIYLSMVTLMLIIPTLVTPVFSHIFIDDILIADNHLIVRPLIIIMIMTFCIQGILLAMQRRMLALLNLKLSLTSAAQFVTHVFRLPILFFSQRYVGDISDRIASNERIAHTLFSDVAVNLINLLMSVFVVIVLLIYNYQLAIITISMMVAHILILLSLNQHCGDANQIYLKERGSLLGISTHGLKIIDTLKANGIENIFFKHWAGHQARMIDARQKLSVYSHILSLSSISMAALTTTIIFFLGSHQIIAGMMSVGGLIAFQLLSQQLLSPIASLVHFGAELQTLKGDLSRLDDILTYQTDDNMQNVLTVDASQYSKLSGLLTVKDVKFSYQRRGHPTLVDINFSLQPGHSIGIIGASGSGKSTLLKLLSRLYKPQTGSITVDGYLYDQIDDLTFSRSVAVVNQDIVLFSGSVRDNLTLWDVTIDDWQIGEALKDAKMLDVINSLPNHYSYQIEEGGRNFSGGQRQQLEIARALIRNPSLLILDEATSALDVTLEKKIIDNIKRRCCSTIITSHRLGVIRDVDMILVLDKGQIVQRGNHQQLIEDADGLYYQLMVSET